jgi:hypothetical protein
MLRFALVLPLAAALAGCVTTNARHIDGAKAEQVFAENKSIVLLHTSLHDLNCHVIEARLAQPDGSGRWVHGPRVYLRTMYDPQLPITLPPGEYGIVELKCKRGNRELFFNRPYAKHGSIIDGGGTLWDRPIASFTVGSGEVVDVGSLRVARPPSSSFLRTEPAVGAVAPTPQAWLNMLAIKNPGLIERRIIRPMATDFRV